MARTRNVFLGFVILANVLTGCVTVACDPDDPKFGKDCYECTRKATLEVRQVDPDGGVSSRAGLCEAETGGSPIIATVYALLNTKARSCSRR
jgi:hypothetical protein